MVIIKEKIGYNAKPRKSEVPLTVQWNNAKMVRIHSIRAATREIINLSNALDVVKVNIIGTPSTGKTTLAKTLAHLVHKMASIPYAVRVFNRDDLLNFEATLSKLQPTNHVLVFDDISFMSATAGKREIDKIQKAFTEIRHLPGGQDVKIIAIFNFHYNMAVSKYMRQSDFFFYTSIGSSEMENTINIVGKQFTNRIREFRKINQEALTTGKFSFLLGKKGQKFTYPWRQPFAPLLFWNNTNLRIVVSPTREWIDPICNKCENAKTLGTQEVGNIEEFDKVLKEKYADRIIKQAMRIKLFLMGASTYTKPVKRCLTDIETAFGKGIFNPSEMAAYYKLVDNETHLYNPAVPKDKPIFYRRNDSIPSKE